MNYGYTTKFVTQSISLNSDFSLAIWPITALLAGTDDIVAQSDVTPEEASGGTKSYYWTKIKVLNILRNSMARSKQREIAHCRRTSIPIIYLKSTKYAVKI